LENNSSHNNNNNNNKSQQQAIRERIVKYVENQLPLEYENALSTMSEMKRRAWNIMETTEDDKTKLAAIETIMNLTHATLDLLMQREVIAQAIDFVQDASAKLDSLKEQQQEQGESLAASYAENNKISEKVTVVLKNQNTGVNV